MISQAHSRVPKCDGQLIKFDSNSISRIAITSAAVQVDWSKVVHSQYRPVCHWSEPQGSTVCVQIFRPRSMENRCSEHKLVRSHSIHLPTHSSPSQVDLENPSVQLSYNPNSPKLAGDVLVFPASAALNGNPTPITSVNTS